MKEKIKNALQQGHKNLGLSEELFERVAAFAETFVTEESGIESFVTSDKTADLLKSYQSVADKARAQAKLKNEPKADPEPPKVEPQEPKPEPQVDIAAIVAQAVAAAINPLQEKLNGFEEAQTQKNALAALDELKATWDYAKGYPAESEDAYERVMELYEASGKKWSADELKTQFTEKFNKLVSKKGVDTSKPFVSENGEGPKTDYADHIAMLKSRGINLSNNK